MHKGQVQGPGGDVCEDCGARTYLDSLGSTNASDCEHCGTGKYSEAFTNGYNNQCGDGIYMAGDETCDDGNTMDGDGCSSTCGIEDGADDGCSVECTVEIGYNCNVVVQPPVIRAQQPAETGTRQAPRLATTATLPQVTGARTNAL